jgi:non-specific serine/threonine protein kinase
VHAIHKLERGTTHPHRDTTNRLVQALRLSADDEAAFRALAEPVPRHRDTTAAATADLRLTRADLPVALTRFVGRQREIVEVEELLRSARLITLTGVGGCGKTRLALEVARSNAAQFSDGVALVELAPLTDGSLVTQAIGSAVGVREAPSRPMLDTLCGALKSRQVLLVLDNCEHLLEACAQQADALLRACPRLTVLATSREPLGLMGEVSWRVPSLAVPPLDPVPPPERLADFQSVQLFVDRAHAVHRPFAITEHNAASVALVCARLDGIPLALELAAVRVRSMDVEALASRLDHRFRLLTGGSRGALPRQQTLRATIDWSYQLLTPAEQGLFKRLSVFASSWTLDAAEVVCSGPGAEREDVVELVLHLVDKSLVLRGESPDAQRYVLLQTLRHYGREQLVAADEAHLFRDRHAAYFLDLAEQTESARERLDTSGWMDPLEAEQADLDSALDWFVAQADVTRALRLTGVLWHLWEVHGALAEGRRRISRVMALRGAEAPTLARARVLNGAGVLALNQHDAVTARRLFRESLALYTRHQHAQGVAWVLIHLSWQCLDIGRPRPARRFLRQATALCEQLGDRRGVARCWNLLGYLAWVEGDLFASRDFHERSLALNRELGERWGTAWALDRLSLTLQYLAEQGEAEPTAARPLIEEALTIWRELGERRHFAFAMCDLAAAAVLEHDFRQAERWLMESESIFAEVGEPLGQVWVVGVYELLLATAGDLESALRVFAATAGALRPFEGATRPVNGWPVPYMERIKRHQQEAERLIGVEATANVLTDVQAMSLSEVIAYAKHASGAIARDNEFGR